jgi:hypothetical protein
MPSNTQDESGELPKKLARNTVEVEMYPGGDALINQGAEEIYLSSDQVQTLYTMMRDLLEVKGGE